jgi:hypothetical protein
LSGKEISKETFIYSKSTKCPNMGSDNPKYRTKNNFFSGKNGSKLYLKELSDICPKDTAV